jgi:hypothetical protein
MTIISHIYYMVKAEDLVKEQNEREKLRNKNYKKIYKIAEKRIIEASKIDLNQCYFEVPHFLINVPLYSQDKCTKYIINKLKTNGFKVHKYDKNKLIINWG